MFPAKVPLSNRFWTKVSKAGPDECWLWMGSKQNKGYGHIGDDGRKKVLAHRVAFELANGPIPKGLCVCHRCDTPPCCNPAHLFLGTQRDNVRDMVSKGRKVHGYGGGRKRTVSDDTLREVFKMIEGGASQRDVARTFGISEAMVSQVKNGRQNRVIPPVR